jgi:hypothetical protein
MHQHIRRLDSDAEHTGQETHHLLGALLGRLFQLTHAGPLDLFDLVLDEPKARHVAAQLAKRVRWHRHVLRRTQRLETLRRIAQFWIEAPDAETGQTGFQPAHDACALADQVLALAVRALGILLRLRCDRDHATMIPLAAQPADKHPLEHLTVEPVRLRPPMLAGHRDAA